MLTTQNMNFAKNKIGFRLWNAETSMQYKHTMQLNKQNLTE